jgi:hypothetical protein
MPGPGPLLIAHFGAAMVVTLVTSSVFPVVARGLLAGRPGLGRAT